MFESVVDPLRLLAVPLLGWAAVRDARTRRVPNCIWLVLGGLGAVLLVVDLVTWYPFDTPTDLLRLTQVGMSCFFVAPLGYFFWRIGGFGGADAKALMALAVLYPTYPRFLPPNWLVEAGLPPVLPAETTTIGVFSLTILTNTVLVAVAFPLVLAVRNAAAGQVGPQMFLARVCSVESLPARHGRLFENREGFTTSGLDLDALRMYLRWRDLSLADLRADSSRYRLPGSVQTTHDPTDGAVTPDVRTDGGSSEATETPTAAGEADADTEGSTAESDRNADPGDDWGAERFLDELDGSAYGTDPETLRDGLETVVANERVWVSPGLPFIVPMFVGLLVALSYGDLLFGFLIWLGLG